MTTREIIKDRLLKMGLIGKEGHDHALDLLAEDVEREIEKARKEEQIRKELKGERNRVIEMIRTEEELKARYEIKKLDRCKKVIEIVLEDYENGKLILEDYLEVLSDQIKGGKIEV